MPINRKSLAMTFVTFGQDRNPSLLLIPGLGVSYEIFLPLIDILKDRFHIVAAGIDGFLLGKESTFTSVDDQAGQIIRYVRDDLGGHLDVAYGLSLGGKILSRMMERDEIVIDHAIMDAAPLLPLPRWSVDPLRYYQSLNVWTCAHWTGFWRRVFHSHYFDVLLDECRKVWPYGKGKAVRDGYKDVYTNKLESIHGADIHYWYGTKEAFVARPQARHLCSLHPDTHVEVFSGMNHGQLLADRPEEVAGRILALVPDILYYSLGQGVEAFTTRRDSVLPYAVIQGHQVHGSEVALITRPDMTREDLEGYDALITDLPGVSIGVRTADCVPVLLYDPVKRVIAAVHSGWKGTVQMISRKVIGIMEDKYGTKPSDLHAVVGPCIGPESFQVGEEVVTMFKDAGFPMDRILKYMGSQGKKPMEGGHHIDLPEACRWTLSEAGVPEENIQVCGIDTYLDPSFYSARREGTKCGRNINAIVLATR